MAKSEKTPDTPIWFDGKNINEALFCDDSLSRHKLIYTDGAFFTPEGRITDELPLRGEIFEELRCCAVSNIPKKINNIVELMKRTFKFIADFEGEIPGQAAKDCGNYLLHALPMAKYEARKYLDEVLSCIREENLIYPTQD